MRSASNERHIAFRTIRLIDKELDPTRAEHKYNGELPGCLSMHVDEHPVKFYYAEAIRSALNYDNSTHDVRHTASKGLASNEIVELHELVKVKK